MRIYIAVLFAFLFSMCVYGAEGERNGKDTEALQKKLQELDKELTEKQSKMYPTRIHSKKLTDYDDPLYSPIGNGYYYRSLFYQFSKHPYDLNFVDK